MPAVTRVRLAINDRTSPRAKHLQDDLASFVRAGEMKNLFCEINTHHANIVCHVTHFYG